MKRKWRGKAYACVTPSSPLARAERFSRSGERAERRFAGKNEWYSPYILGHIKFFFFSNFNIGEYFFGAFLCVEQMLENTFSSKKPFSFVNLTINFTKGLAQK